MPITASTTTIASNVLRMGRETVIVNLILQCS
jgi:hypothetical protein